MGFEHFVNKPIRGKYVLYLLFTDVKDLAASNIAAAADHRCVLTKV